MKPVSSSLRTSKIPKVELKKLSRKSMDDAVDFIGRAMNADEGAYARKALRYHFKCRLNKINDGRSLYVWMQDGDIQGMVGLHHYEWGPKENVWLSWFAVGKQWRKRGVGRKLIELISSKAFKMGFRKLFVETYSGPDFQDARLSYEKIGFKKAGKISNYLPNRDDMIVFCMDLK